MMRWIVQIAFLLLTLVGVFVFGANCEKWCPFGGVESLYTYLHEGALTCSHGVSNFYVRAAVLLATLLVGRAFCGYVCPLGTIGRLCRAITEPYVNFDDMQPMGQIMYLPFIFHGYDPMSIGPDIKVWTVRGRACTPCEP